MKRILITFICLIGYLTPYIHAYNSISCIIYSISEEEKPLPLKAKDLDPENDGEPNPRTLIPEVTLQDRTLHFITPCNGCTFRLAQSGNISYEVEITGNMLAIPASFTGMYELQIVSGDTIFYTEVVL